MLVRTVLVALLLAGLAGPSPGQRAALQLERPPLRALVSNSALIVSGVVESVDAGDATRPGLLRVRVERVLEGELEGPLLRIQARPASTAADTPGPGSAVLAFLDDAEAGAAPRALLPLEGRALAVHVHRTEQLLEILRLSVGTTREAALADWLVELVEDPVTRRDGLHDLGGLTRSRDGDRIRLDPAQRARLGALLLSWRGVSPEGLDLARLLGRHDDPRLSRWLWSQLNDHEGPRAELAAGYMQALSERLDDAPARRLALEHDRLAGAEVGAARRARVARFLAHTESRVFVEAEPAAEGESRQGG